MAKNYVGQTSPHANQHINWKASSEQYSLVNTAAQEETGYKLFAYNTHHLTCTYAPCLYVIT